MSLIAQSATSPFVTRESHVHSNQTVCSYELRVCVTVWVNVLYARVTIINHPRRVIGQSNLPVAAHDAMCGGHLFQISFPRRARDGCAAAEAQVRTGGLILFFKLPPPPGTLTS